MPITKRLDRRDGVIYIHDAQTGKLLLAVSEKYQLKNNEAMNLLWSMHARTAAIAEAYRGESRVVLSPPNASHQTAPTGNRSVQLRRIMTSI